MPEKYTSERLRQDLPRPLLNFLWYLWDTYYVPKGEEFRISLQDTGNAQGLRFTIYPTGETTTKDFDCRANVSIAFRKEGARVFMEYC